MLPSSSNQLVRDVATISFLSAKGSPGVTTSVVALACAWAWAHPGRTALAIDADPVGGDAAAGVLRGEVPPGAGVLSLATSRGLGWREAIRTAAVPLGSGDSARIVPGVPDAARAPALALAWSVLADHRAELHSENFDVLVDAGRMAIPGRQPGSSGGHAAVENASPWLSDSDFAVVVVRPGLPGVLAAHRLAVDWPLTDVPLQLLVANAPSPYHPREVARAVGLPLLGVLPYDPAAARVYSDGAPLPRGFGRGGYVRGVRQVAGAAGSRARQTAEPELTASESGTGVDVGGADAGASVVRRD